MTSPNVALTPASSRPAYVPNLFVDRASALELVLGKARRLADGELVKRRVVIFLGQRGAGKTWLLQELQHRLHDMELETRFIDLERLWLAAEEHVGFAMADFRALLEGVQRPLVLLMDNAQEGDDPLLRELEERVLARLTWETDVLIVLAERGRPHYWLTPDLRETSHEHELEPFGEPDVEAQLQKQVPDHELPIGTIETLSGGYPWLTYLIARFGPEATDLFVDQFWGDEDKGLVAYAEALCILRAFDEVRMVPLLQVYSDEFVRESKSRRTRAQIQRRLVDTTFVRWDADARGYVIDEPLRLVLEAGLRARDLELWKKLHRAAYYMYEDWSSRFTQSSAWWAQERDYHRQRLEEAGCEAAVNLKAES